MYNNQVSKITHPFVLHFRQNSARTHVYENQLSLLLSMERHCSLYCSIVHCFIPHDWRAFPFHTHNVKSEYQFPIVHFTSSLTQLVTHSSYNKANLKFKSFGFRIRALWQKVRSPTTQMSVSENKPGNENSFHTHVLVNLHNLRNKKVWPLRMISSEKTPQEWLHIPFSNYTRATLNSIRIHIGERVSWLNFSDDLPV